jgi:hypothetical protein
MCHSRPSELHEFRHGSSATLFLGSTYPDPPKGLEARSMGYKR